jgi:hypothetical protein
LKPVGELYQLKASPDEIRLELIPSFRSVIRSWTSGVMETRFADPDYVISITKLTDPLKLFIKRIVDNLGLSVVGGPIERGFGFGKTHTLILLWHIFTSDVYVKLDVSIPRDLVRETLVIGMDCTHDRPLAMVVDVLRAYTSTQHSIARVKDTKLLMAVSQVLERYRVEELYDSEKLAKIIAEILAEYRRRGGRPKLLLLVDELGYGLASRLKRYAERASGGRVDAEEAYVEALSVVNFLDYLYGELSKESLPAVILWVVADQDRRDVDMLKLMYKDNNVIIDKINGLMGRLDVIGERYSRGLAGMGIAELSYSPDHAIEIAIYRVLEPLRGVDTRGYSNVFVDLMRGRASMLNLTDDFRKIEGDLKRHYPLSPGVIALLRKLMSFRDAPRTEYVRTIIQVVAEAAKVALKEDPQGSYTIALKHLELPYVVQAKLMGSSEIDWIYVASDIEEVLGRLDGEDYEAAEAVAKYILAKGVTDYVLALESRDRVDIERYGSTMNEIQLEILSSYADEARVTKLLDRVASSLELLKVESGRISERDVDGKRYYMLAILKTLYSELAKLVQEEAKVLEDKTQIPVYMVKKGTIPSLFEIKSAKRGEVNVLVSEYSKVRDVDALLSDPTFREAQSKGRMLVIIAPPWDLGLFNEMYEKGSNYDGVVHSIAKRIQARAEDIGKPLHIVILIPNLSAQKVDGLMKMLVVYEGTKRFLGFLHDRERNVESLVSSYVNTVVSKRQDLVKLLEREYLSKLEASIRSKLEKEINDAKSLAQRQLVRLTRDIVQEVLGLYGKAVYFNLDGGKFEAKDLRISFQQVEGAQDTWEMSRYAITFNRFLDGVLEELGYVEDVERVANAIKDHIVRKVEAGDRVEGSVADVDNALLGTYGVKPLSSRIVIEALRRLSGELIEVKGARVKLRFVEDKRSLEATYEVIGEVKEVVGVKPPVVEPKPTPPEGPIVVEDLVDRLAVELPAGFNAEELRSRLEKLVDKVKLSRLELEFKTKGYSLVLNVEKPSKEVFNDRHVKTFINLVSRSEGLEDLRVLLKIELSKPEPRQTLKELLGGYLEATRSSFDRLIR